MLFRLENGIYKVFLFLSNLVDRLMKVRISIWFVFILKVFFFVFGRIFVEYEVVGFLGVREGRFGFILIEMLKFIGSFRRRKYKVELREWVE